MTSNGDGDAKQTNKPQQNGNSIQNCSTMMQGLSSIRKQRNGMALKRYRSVDSLPGSVSFNFLMQLLPSNDFVNYFLNF